MSRTATNRGARPPHSLLHLPRVPEPSVSHDRARITAGELAIVCSRYDLGDVQSVRPFKAGSRASPKVILVTSRGVFVLKRRAAPAPDAARTEWLHRVALSHEIVLHLAARALPAPVLLGTRDEHNSMLQLGEHVYELYRYVPGRAYDRTPDSARAAGELLALCHLALRDLRPSWPPPRRSYHALAQLPALLQSLPERLTDPALVPPCNELAEQYQRAAAAAAAALGALPEQIVHGDWHPGNLVYADGPRIAAVLDFDTVSLAPAIVDATNGALQFALRRRPVEHPQPGRAHFGVAFDPRLFSAFWAGYRTPQAGPAGPDWPSAAVPWLCIEAIIAEAALPVAATGRFGRFSGSGVLRLARRTAAWMENHQATLVRLATNP